MYIPVFFAILFHSPIQVCLRTRAIKNNKIMIQKIVEVTTKSRRCEPLVQTNRSKSDSSSYSYSMEKYLDPNRPFKCEVCKESFTQKNILLVHYNSVSHLHRLKKTMQEQQQQQQQQQNSPENTAAAVADNETEMKSTQEKTPTKGSALEALLGNIRGERKR